MSRMRLMEAVIVGEMLQGDVTMQHSTDPTLSGDQMFAPAAKMANCFAADTVDNS